MEEGEGRREGREEEGKGRTRKGGERGEGRRGGKKSAKCYL